MSSKLFPFHFLVLPKSTASNSLQTLAISIVDSWSLLYSQCTQMLWPKCHASQSTSVSLSARACNIVAMYFPNFVPVTQSGLLSGGMHSFANIFKVSHTLIRPFDCFLGLAKTNGFPLVMPTFVLVLLRRLMLSIIPFVRMMGTFLPLILTILSLLDYIETN